MTSKDIELAAMKLPTARRAKLAASLLASLDNAAADEIDQAWTAEAGRRIRRYRQGEASAVPAATALAKAREALR